jgi:uncharacterized protein (TIGR03084 family)
MADLAPLLDDLRAESADLDRLVADLDDATWATPTPATGWSVAHQIAHLAWTDSSAHLAATDPDGFTAQVSAIVAGGQIDGYVDAAAEEGAQRPPAELLALWRSVRENLAGALATTAPGTKIPWYGPPMSAASLATARLMETWAHGEDVAEALGVRRPPTERLRHVAYLAVRTRGFSFLSRGTTPPEAEIRVELTAPDGSLWTFGPEDAPERVTGPAIDFCRLATRRAHRDDLALTATGPGADRWLDITQAFAGPPGTDPVPGGAR